MTGWLPDIATGPHLWHELAGAAIVLLVLYGVMRVR